MRLPTAKGFAGSVLLIEDDEAVRQAISMVLIEQGYRIVAAANPAHAIGLLELGIRVARTASHCPCKALAPALCPHATPARGVHTD